jgi:hypothetical protein
LLKTDQFGLDKPLPVPRRLHRKIKQHLHSVLLAIPLLAVAAGVAEAAGEAVAGASRQSRKLLPLPQSKDQFLHWR